MRFLPSSPAFLLAFLFCNPCVGAKEWPVADVPAFDAAVKAAQPGDAIVLADGEWRDAQLRFVGTGTDAKPITLRAKTPGALKLTGSSSLRIAGRYLTVDGLWFIDPAPAQGDVIEFRLDSKLVSQNCRLTNTSVVAGVKDPEGPRKCHWISLYGSNHQVDHCLVQNKTTEGATMVVWLGDESTGSHRITENFFGPRSPLGRNGGETIRVGDSKTSMMKGRVRSGEELVRALRR